MEFFEITAGDIPELFRIRTSVRENLLTMDELEAAGITAESVTQMLGSTHKGWLCRIGGKPVCNNAAGDGLAGNGAAGDEPAGNDVAVRDQRADLAGVAAGFVIADGSTGELWVLAVLPEFEGQGIGSELLRRAEQWLFAQGHEELWLWTDTDTSLRAYKLYTRHGWQPAEVKDGDLYLRKRAQ